MLGEGEESAVSDGRGFRDPHGSAGMGVTGMGAGGIFSPAVNPVPVCAGLRVLGFDWLVHSFPHRWPSTKLVFNHVHIQRAFANICLGRGLIVVSEWQLPHHFSQC
jgi:hypothetical protein